MTRRHITTFFLFLFLILLNLFITLKFFARTQKTAAMNTILEEIDSAAVVASQEVEPAGTATATSSATARKVANLKSFFRTYSAPLYDHAELIVKVSEKHNMDYRLLPAIAMQESTLCKFIPQNSHNCWGWGIYGDKVTRFASYEEAIETVAGGLKKNYIDKGRTTTAQIMAVYTPSSNGSWARGVNSVLKLLE